MARFAVAARSLRGPFTTLISKLVVTAKRVLPTRVGQSARRNGKPDRNEAKLMAKAVGARDAELLRLRRVRSRDRPATVVGAYDVRTGKVVVGESSQLRRECAEGQAVRKLGGDMADVRFTIAKRPTKAGPPFRDVGAQYCEPAYGRGAFPEPGTLFESDLR